MGKMRLGSGTRPQIRSLEERPEAVRFRYAQILAAQAPY